MESESWDQGIQDYESALGFLNDGVDDERMKGSVLFSIALLKEFNGDYEGAVANVEAAVKVLEGWVLLLNGKYNDAAIERAE